MESVPKIDALAGIGCYCTDFPGIGGSIKEQHSGFRVEEIVFDSLLAGVSKNYDGTHKYPLYMLEKHGIDSNHALIEIEKQTGLRLKVMGIKDAKAETKQYASTSRPETKPQERVVTNHSMLSLVGFASKPISKDQLAGNLFTIELYGTQKGDLNDFVHEIDKIANFYGLQRFGSERLVSHLVGREIVKRNFTNAVELLLSYTTEYDSAFSKEIREQMRDPGNYSRAMKMLPRGMDIEKTMLTSLCAGKGAREALRTIPITIRRLFVQAYQAFIFNKCVSNCLLLGENIIRPQKGDLVFEMENEFAFGRVIKFDPGRKGKVVPAVMLPGYSFQIRSGRFEEATKSIMDEEGVSPRDFYIKEMDELSQQGSFRQTPLWCKGFTHSVQNPLRVTFSLPKGSYATILLREIMKTVDPIKAGF